MGRECKVLIVDDEFITRQGISHMIIWEQEGFLLVGEASNGQEGIEMIEKYQPDIVLADIVMPVLNGIEFSMILQEKYPNIKLIILSSYDNFEYVRTTLLNGAVDYVDVYKRQVRTVQVLATVSERFIGTKSAD